VDEHAAEPDRGAPKSTTTAVAVQIAEGLGGVPALTALAVISTGVIASSSAGVAGRIVSKGAYCPDCRSIMLSGTGASLTLVDRL
jgi:hypothetical protein